MPEERYGDLLEWIRQAYGASRCEVLETAERTVGALFRVRIADEVVWLRVGGVLNRSVERTEHEGRQLSEFVRLGIAVQKPKRRADGRYCERLQLTTCAGVAIAFGEVAGVELTTPDRRRAQAWGRTLRELHDASSGESATGLARVEPLTNGHERLALATAALTPQQARELEEIVAEKVESLTPLGNDDVVSHGDVRCANVRFQEERAVLIDTETLGLAPPAYDLACAWRRRVVENQMRHAPEDWDWFKEGYEEAGPIEEAVWQQVSDMACLRALWTMTLPAEIEQGWGRAWLSDAGYWAAHLEHVKWFATHTP